MSLSNSGVMRKELDAFKIVHISFGAGPAPRTGLLNDKGFISIDEFAREAFRASYWPMSRVLAWLEDGKFELSNQAFRELALHGHAFFRLAEDTDGLRWKLIEIYTSGNIPESCRLLSFSEYKLKCDRELARLSRHVQELISYEDGI